MNYISDVSLELFSAKEEMALDSDPVGESANEQNRSQC